MSASPSVRAIAPAKINLSLEVLGRRDDGFHEIKTSVLAVDLCDRLELSPNGSGRSRFSLLGDHASADAPAGDSNLAFRAVRAALEAGRRLGAVGEQAGFDLVLEKRIPSRAGLGGGSSDAAAAWVAACAAFGLEILSPERDAALAALGSDCAFFAGARETGFARCEGRGERVIPAARPESVRWIALVAPAVECATAAVYAAWRPRPGASAPGRNDLEEPALRVFPALRKWRGLLDGLGLAAWTLCGSGSAFFALFDAEEDAARALEAVRAAAGEGGLPLRGTWRLRPAGHGANIVAVP